MGQNRYDRSYDNDRAPEPEKSLFTRIRLYFKESAEDYRALFGKARKQSLAKAESRREVQEERRVARQKKADLRREKRKAKATGKETSLSGEDETLRYGKDDFTQQNHITGDDSVADELLAHRTGRRFALTKRAWVYLALLIGAFIFTQGLQSRVSNIFFGFVVFLPLALVLYTLTARFALQMHMVSDGATVTKREPYTYELRLINQSIFAYPFVEAIMILPQGNSVRCGVRSVYLAMAPLGSYAVKSEVRFRFRGSYAIGLDCFYVYDFFRLMRIRVDVRNSVTVHVLPRRLLLDGNEMHAHSDEPDLSNRRATAMERVEIGDIRNYLPGDPLKLIHWNLTSRLEEPVVKDYNGGKTNLTYIYCDLAARFPDEAPASPTLSRAEEKRMRRDRKERRLTERRKARAIAWAEKHGDALREEDLAALDVTPSEKREAQRAKKAEARRRARIAHISALQKKNPHKAAYLRDRLRDEDRAKAEEAKAELSEQEGAASESVHLLADPSYYEDMNEYCADGIIDLALASALRELRCGNEVVLIWQDSRSASGFCAYSFRSAGELSTVYPLFATAPLTRRVAPLLRFSAYAGDTSGVKQIFVTAMIDESTVSDFCDGAALSAGGEVLLYTPEERFLTPDRRRAYLADCAEVLSKRGIALTCKNPGEEGYA